MIKILKRPCELNEVGNWTAIVVRETRQCGTPKGTWNTTCYSLEWHIMYMVWMVCAPGSAVLPPYAHSDEKKKAISGIYGNLR